jgi:protein involved in polysaccharide export with SLBB domain
MIDYPMAIGPIQVSGLTTEAIAARLKANIRVIDASPITVKVRDFSSHSVNVIGFVQSPGAKVLRREAVPLYVLLAEAAPLKDAASATVVRNGQNVAVIDLHNVAASNQLILHGDVIKVSDRPAGR